MESKFPNDDRLEYADLGKRIMTNATAAGTELMVQINLNEIQIVQSLTKILSSLTKQRKKMDLIHLISLILYRLNPNSDIAINGIYMSGQDAIDNSIWSKMEELKKVLTINFRQQTKSRRKKIDGLLNLFESTKYKTCISLF